MTDLELIFTMLDEKVTTEVSKKEKPNSFDKNKQVAKRGGSVAGNAGKTVETVKTNYVFYQKPTIEIVG